MIKEGALGYPNIFQARDEARHVVKKVTKEISRLFSKKNCMDISGGDLGKKKKKPEKEKDSKFMKYLNPEIDC